jgi:hypothetical protein
MSVAAAGVTKLEGRESTTLTGKLLFRQIGDTTTTRVVKIIASALIIPVVLAAIIDLGKFLGEQIGKGIAALKEKIQANGKGGAAHKFKGFADQLIKRQEGLTAPERKKLNTAVHQSLTPDPKTTPDDLLKNYQSLEKDIKEDFESRFNDDTSKKQSEFLQLVRSISVDKYVNLAIEDKENFQSILTKGLEAGLLDKPAIEKHINTVFSQGLAEGYTRAEKMVWEFLKSAVKYKVIASTDTSAIYEKITPEFESLLDAVAADCIAEGADLEEVGDKVAEMVDKGFISKDQESKFGARIHEKIKEIEPEVTASGEDEQVNQAKNNAFLKKIEEELAPFKEQKKELEKLLQKRDQLLEDHKEFVDSCHLLGSGKIHVILSDEASEDMSVSDALVCFADRKQDMATFQAFINKDPTLQQAIFAFLEALKLQNESFKKVESVIDQISNAPQNLIRSENEFLTEQEESERVELINKIDEYLDIELSNDKLLKMINLLSLKEEVEVEKEPPKPEPDVNVEEPPKAEEKEEVGIDDEEDEVEFVDSIDDGKREIDVQTDPVPPSIWDRLKSNAKWVWDSNDGWGG